MRKYLVSFDKTVRKGIVHRTLPVVIRPVRTTGLSSQAFTTLEDVEEAQRQAVDVTTPRRPAPIEFENKFVNRFPADKETQRDIRQVHGAAYSLVDPLPVENPRVAHYSPSLWRFFGLSEVRRQVEIELPGRSFITAS